MANWIQNQMRAAERVLNAVDSAVMKKVGHAESSGDVVGSGQPSLAEEGEPAGRTSSSGFVYATSGSPFGVLGSPAQKPSTTRASSTGSSSGHGEPNVGDGGSDGTSAPEHISRGATPGLGFSRDGAPTTASSSSSSLVFIQHTDGLAPGHTTTAQHAAPQAAITPFPAAPMSMTDSVMSQQLSEAPRSSVLPLPPSMAVGSKRSSGTGTLTPTPLPPPAEGTSGSSAREQQLTRLVAELKERLKSSKMEGDQLEDMLAKAEARCERERALLGQLQGEMTAVQESKTLMEAALHSQLNQQAVSLQEAQQRVDVLSRQVLALEGQLAVATESSRNMLQNRTDLEGGMLEALHGQLSSVESQLDAERRAHASSRSAAVARERELEAAAAGTMAALAETQHSLQQSSLRVCDLEDALALATARQQELEQQLGSGQAAGASQGTTQHDVLKQELQRLQTEVVVQREGCQQAVATRTAAQAEATHLRAELQQLRAEMEQGSWRKDASALESSLREAHELLYQKQATIERLSADRAALQLRLEREVATAARSKAEVDHHTLSMTDTHRPALGLTALSGADNVVPTGSVLGERFKRLASRQDNLGTALAAATGLVDRTASLTAHLLKQYPLVRLMALMYLLGIHLYVYVITLSMQHAAVVMEAGAAGGDWRPCSQQGMASMAKRFSSGARQVTLDRTEPTWSVGPGPRATGGYNSSWAHNSFSRTIS